MCAIVVLARWLAENGRTEDLRPLTQSEHQAVGIQGPRSSRLLGCSARLRCKLVPSW
jgi:hypothetical protein